MKFGLSNDIYEKIKEIVEKNRKYKFKIFGSRAKNTKKEFLAEIEKEGIEIK